MNQNFTKYAFTDSVKKSQERYGTRRSYSKMETAGDRYQLSDREIKFIRSRDSFYIATVGENGWPYVQHRGGTTGFLRVFDNTKLGYADFRGNGQYISTGNLQANSKASIILMDYPSQQRLKLWVETTILEADKNAELVKRIEVENYTGRIERATMFTILAFDWNCPQHITPRYTLKEIKLLKAELSSNS